MHGDGCEEFSLPISAHDRVCAVVSLQGQQLRKDAAIEQNGVSEAVCVVRRDDRGIGFAPEGDKGVDDFGIDFRLIAKEEKRRLCVRR